MDVWTPINFLKACKRLSFTSRSIESAHKFATKPTLAEWHRVPTLPVE